MITVPWKTPEVTSYAVTVLFPKLLEYNNGPAAAVRADRRARAIKGFVDNPGPTFNVYLAICTRQFLISDT